MQQRFTLIVGLGNPGAEYAQTRHNAGFWFVDALAEKYNGRFSSNKKLRAEIAEISIQSMRVRLLKPQTFMNLSGEAVITAANYFKIEPEQILVAYDEIDFEPGKIRLKFNGGHAGHNGIRNIIAHLGRNFWRLRIGVGHPGEQSKVVSHVLKRASGSDADAIMTTITRGIDVLPTLIKDGAERAQLILHTDDHHGN